MTDKELIEAAALAAGIVVVRSRLDNPIFLDMVIEDSHRNLDERLGPWNPLTDDGDALRLAVKLGISIYPPESDGDDATANTPSISQWICENTDVDPYAATRRAITRAAAAMAK